MLHAIESNPIPLDSPKAGRVALKGFFAIVEGWGITTEQQRTLLGSIPKSTLYNYRKLPEVSLTRDLLERISLVMGIHKALLILFGDRDQTNRWISRPNAAEPFGGQSALERMLGGSVIDLAVVRQYLDAQRS